MIWRKTGFQQLSMASEQSNTPWTKTIACIALHIILVLVHIALLVVYSRHYEHSVTADIGSSFGSRFALVVTVLSQTVGAVSPHCNVWLILYVNDLDLFYIDLSCDSSSADAATGFAKRPTHSTDTHCHPRSIECMARTRILSMVVVGPVSTSSCIVERAVHRPIPDGNLRIAYLHSELVPRGGLQ